MCGLVRRPFGGIEEGDRGVDDGLDAPCERCVYQKVRHDSPQTVVLCPRRSISCPPAGDNACRKVIHGIDAFKRVTKGGCVFEIQVRVPWRVNLVASALKEWDESAPYDAGAARDKDLHARTSWCDRTR